MPIFACCILPPRAGFATSMRPAEMAIMGRRFEHPQPLHGQGLIRLVGLAENGDYGLCVLEAYDAHAMARPGPARRADDGRGPSLHGRVRCAG
ncbi:hypothetical protein FHG66_02835 [Rubellimicrobium rubrum]|uniref:Uncharacterized protein n=1 Tax=Rubellimicrobium rubrum TaxID=2585369 RepID=A0A5C4N4F8_9RHOB|nr:hypothetical protein [Rubellimicrobium rubrum]TNC52486.1 hypothetical protein FHG66_02835 [Rubellimicrobium rubrum]